MIIKISIPERLRDGMPSDKFVTLRHKFECEKSAHQCDFFTLWTPQWYELDQSIVVGDIDFFYLSRDGLHFANDFAGDCDCEVRAEIVKITHPELGDIKGIIAIGLSYSIYLSDGSIVIVNAEEHPGSIENCRYVVTVWDFDVQISMIEITGLSSKERLKKLSQKEINTLRQERIGRYKVLLDLSEADWDQ